MPMHRSRSLVTIASVVTVLGLAACGGGGSTASAGTTTTTTTTAPAPGQRRAGAGRVAAAAQAFAQCLRDQGFEVGDLPAGGRPSGGGGGGGGEFPRPPAGGSAPAGATHRDPAVMAQRLAQRLGLDTTDESVAAAVSSCSARLG